MSNFITVLMLIIGLLVGNTYGSYLNRAPQREAIAECEKNLPRDQHCTVIGIKKEETK